MLLLLRTCAPRKQTARWQKVLCGKQQMLHDMLLPLLLLLLASSSFKLGLSYAAAEAETETATEAE